MNREGLGAEFRIRVELIRIRIRTLRSNESGSCCYDRIRDRFFFNPASDFYYTGSDPDPKSCLGVSRNVDILINVDFRTLIGLKSRGCIRNQCCAGLRFRPDPDPCVLLILDGISIIGSHAKSEIKSSRIFEIVFEKFFFLLVSTTCSELLSKI